MVNTFTITQDITGNIEVLTIASDGCHTGYTPFPATDDNYECVDDSRLEFDDDETYVYSTTSPSLYDLYLLDNVSITGSINYINVVARSKANLYPQSRDGTYKLIITDDACSNIYKSGDKSITTTYSNYSCLWGTNPRTGLSWTWDDIDNLQVGIESTSPSVDVTMNTVLRPNGDNASFDSAEPYPATPATLYDKIDDESADGLNTYLWYAPTIGGRTVVFDFEDHTTQSGVINSVTIYCVARLPEGLDRWGTPINNGDREISIGFYINGTKYFSDAKDMNTSWTLYSYSLATNPDTSSAWTWTNIDDLIGGWEDVRVTGSITSPYITQIYIVVNHTESGIIPQIRTTQMYAVVNYDKLGETVSLPIPDAISHNHSRNVKMFNFWNGEREVYSLNRNNKTLVLSGIDWSDTACDNMLAVRSMGKNGNTVSITGLNMYIFNDDYKILSFGWKEITQNPSHFEWILELEYVD